MYNITTNNNGIHVITPSLQKITPQCAAKVKVLYDSRIGLACQVIKSSIQKSEGEVGILYYTQIAQNEQTSYKRRQKYINQILEVDHIKREWSEKEQKYHNQFSIISTEESLNPLLHHLVDNHYFDNIEGKIVQISDAGILVETKYCICDYYFVGLIPNIFCLQNKKNVGLILQTRYKMGDSINVTFDNTKQANGKFPMNKLYFKEL